MPVVSDIDAPAEPPGRGWRATALTLCACIGAPAGALLIAFFWGSVWGLVGVAVLVVAVIAWLISLFGAGGRARANARPAGRRYSARVAVTMGLVYPVLFFGALWLYKHGWASGPLGYPIAIAPALPLVGMFLIFQRFLREETDEVLRAALMSSLVWSGALTLCEATIWGFLETFGKAPNVWMWAVPVAFFAQLGVTMPLAQRRYS
jgi:hypothetical protein